MPVSERSFVMRLGLRYVAIGIGVVVWGSVLLPADSGALLLEAKENVLYDRARFSCMQRKAAFLLPMKHVFTCCKIAHGHIEPAVAPNADVLARIKNLKGNQAVLLGKAQVVGDFN